VKDSFVKTFVKADKVNVTVKGDSAPRIISPRDPRYNLALGVYIKPIEGVLYKLLNSMCGGTTVMKGLNAVEVGEAVFGAWSEFSDPVAIGFDAVRFDQHTERAQLRYEQFIYSLFFDGGDKADIVALLKLQLNNYCAAYTPEGIVKFVMSIRCSGDMNTGLGTCLIACSLVHSFCETFGINYRLINNGDDCVLVCEKADLEVVEKELHNYMLLAGYYFEVEPAVHRIEHIEFCQSHPVYTERGWTMVRNFPNCIDKDCVSILPLDGKKAWMKWANDIGLGGMALCAGVPILYEFYKKLAGLGDGSFGRHPTYHNTGVSYLTQGLNRDEVQISQEARVSFYEAYGFTPDYQIVVEKELHRQDIDFDHNLVGYNYIDLNNIIIHSLTSNLFDYHNYNKY
jgi:hypothetical protein